jgi:hypothetical protein
MRNDSLKRLILRFVTFAFLGVIIVSAGVLLFLVGPKPYIYANGDWDGYRYIPEYDQSQGSVLFDSHAHTLQSGGSLTVEQLIQWNIAMGYNACVVSDSFDPIYADPWITSHAARDLARAQYNDSIKILLGMEYHTARIHINIILPPDAEDYETLFTFHKNPTDTQIQEFINTVHSLNGICIADHLLFTYEGSINAPSRQDLLDWGIDYIEVINGDVYDRDSEIFCDENDVGKMATSGMHDALDPVTGWLLVNTTTFTEESIFNALKDKNTTMINEPWGAPYPFQHQNNLAYDILRPLIQVGDLVEDYNPTGSNLDIIAASFLVINLAGVFIISELFMWILTIIYRKMQTLRSRMKNKKEDS